MSMTTTTHLNFRGQARAALEFYQSVFGGDLVVVTFADMNAINDPAEAGQVMWGQVAVADGFRVMAFDVPAARPFDRGQQSFFVSVRGQTAEEVQRTWDRLSAGAEVLTPIGPAAFSALYGMLSDRFGITWVVDVEPQQAG